MTDILLALILVFTVLAWAEHSMWLADRRRGGQKLRERIRRAHKNWRHSRRTSKPEGRR